MIADLVVCVLLPVEFGMFVTGACYGLSRRDLPWPLHVRIVGWGLVFGLWPVTLPWLLWEAWWEHRRRRRHD
jgi:hypothetical protein